MRRGARGTLFYVTLRVATPLTLLQSLSPGLHLFCWGILTFRPSFSLFLRLVVKHVAEYRAAPTYADINYLLRCESEKFPDNLILPRAIVRLSKIINWNESGYANLKMCKVAN